MGQAVVMVAGADPLTGVGGDASYIRAHARAARRASFAPHIFCVSPREAVVEAEFGTVYRVPTPARLVRAVMAFVMGPAAPRIIHSFGIHGHMGVEAARRLRRRGIRVAAVTSAHDTVPPERPAGRRAAGAVARLWRHFVVDRRERRAYTEADLVLVNYDSVRQALAERYGLADTVRTITYAPPSAFLVRGGTSRGLGAAPALPGDAPPLVVAVARHDPRKGLDVLIEALARVRASGIPFRACLVGGGSLLATHRRRVEDLGLASVVRVEGFVPDPYPYLEDAHVFVQPSLGEGRGSLALLEALQAGAAVVASAVDGIPEDVVDGDSALLVEPGNPEALGAALARVLSDGDLRRRLAQRGHATFEARFSAPAFTAALCAAYASVGGAAAGRREAARPVGAAC
jgi:glycosyltransferase involved in cell wall biosynthesis